MQIFSKESPNAGADSSQVRAFGWIWKLALHMTSEPQKGCLLVAYRSLFKWLFNVIVISYNTAYMHCIGECGNKYTLISKAASSCPQRAPAH